MENNKDNHGASTVGGLAQRVYAGVRATIGSLGQSHSQELAAIVASSDDAIISKDLDGVIATWNKGAEKIFGYTASEAIGQPISILFPADWIDDEASILARIRSGERIDIMRQCGKPRMVSASTSP